MLGRLARYLRFVGCDTAYAQGLTDPEIADWADRERRRLLTRDRALSRQVPGAILLASPSLGDQWKALRTALPTLPAEVSFERCTLCNGRLAALAEPIVQADPAVPEAIRRRNAAVFACDACGHRYWDGSHSARVRAQLAAWEAEIRS